MREPNIGQAICRTLVQSAGLSEGLSALYLSHQMSMRFLKDFSIVLRFWYALFWF